MAQEKHITTPRKYPNLRPQDCALLVIDVLNDFYDNNGAFAKAADISHIQRTLEPIKKMIRFCHEMDIPILVPIVAWKGVVEMGVLAKIRPLLVEGFKRGEGALKEGTWGDELVPELGVDRKKDYLIYRKRSSSFYQTQIDLILRALKRNTVIVTGCLTQSCCEMAMRDIYQRDFQAVELSDCVGTIGGKTVDPITHKDITVTAEEMHYASLRAMVYAVGDVLTSDELMEELRRNK